MKNRRRFCLSLLLIVGLSGLAHAGALREKSASKKQLFVIARLEYRGGHDNPRPTSVAPFLNYVVSRTSLEVMSQSPPVKPEAPEIFNYPFILWAGDQEFSPLAENQIENLRRYLQYGGFILVDDAQAHSGFGFDASFRREMQRIFPKNQLVKLGQDHAVYRSFYLLNQIAGRVQNKNYLEGIQIGKRTVLIYSQNDLLGAWSRDPFGNWEFQVTPGGEEQRTMAMRLGVNLVMYALCDDYKKDSLHVDYILKRRRSL